MNFRHSFQIDIEAGGLSKWLLQAAPKDRARSAQQLDMQIENEAADAARSG